MGKCICGAKVKIPHTGDCHFGWHNPDTCPQLNCPRDHRNTPSGNKITADEKNLISAAEKNLILKEIAHTILNTGKLYKDFPYIVMSEEFTERAAREIIKHLDSIGYDANV